MHLLTAYAVVFIDLQGSSSAPSQRAGLQQQLIALRDHLNQCFPSSLAVQFQIVWGDELKGVLRDPSTLWTMYQEAYAFMGSTPFYFAVGLGSVDTPLTQHGDADINQLDGTAFKAARLAIDELKARKAGPYQVRFATAGYATYADALNAFMGVLNDLVTHMTPAQTQHFVREYPWHGAQTQAGKTQVSRQAVWETLQRARIDAYRAASEGLVALLQLVPKCPEVALPIGGDSA